MTGLVLIPVSYREDKNIGMRYFIIAGEASGDAHASRLMSALKREDAEASFMFLGGDRMAAVGGVMVRHYRDMAFMGIVNVLLNAGKVMENIRLCRKAIEGFRPDAVILVDYPGFNLRMARWVKKRMPGIAVYYYIAPKLWAWKSWRIGTIRRYVDRMFTIFPFETEYFSRKGYEVTYVGNPTADAVGRFIAQYHEGEFRRRHGLGERPIVALLPGSRRQEIKGCLRKMLRMAEEFPDRTFVIAGAPGVERGFYTAIAGDGITVVTGETYALLRTAEAAIVNSGTASLETALLDCPQAVVYHVFGGVLASLLQKVLIKIPYVSLVNINLGRFAVRELIAGDFTEENVRREMRALLYDEDYTVRMRRDYAELRRLLGGEGAAERCAGEIYRSLSAIKNGKGATSARQSAS